MKMTTSPVGFPGEVGKIEEIRYDRPLFYAPDEALREITPEGIAEEDEPWKEGAEIVVIQNNIAIWYG